MNAIQLEICIDSVAGAMAAERGGADRLELCAALSEGGITPSHGLIQQVLAHTKLPVMTMIRPRGGPFVYSTDEIDVMLRDIEIAKQLGVHGIVFGAVTSSMEVDTQTCATLLQAAGSLQATFHRAFDEPGVSAEAACQQIENLGFHRLLTSGQTPSVADGTQLVSKLVEQSEKLIVMPGAGVRPENVESIIRQTGATEIHGTASTFCETSQRKVTCEETVRTIRGLLNRL